MNRRQKRKQFKKIYGMTPEQYEKWYREHWPELIREGMNNFSEALRRMGTEVSEAIREIGESWREYGKELNQAMKYTETENMLRKANQMPEGVDKSLLKHIGIRTDRAGWYMISGLMRQTMSILWNYCRKG